MERIQLLILSQDSELLALLRAILQDVAAESCHLPVDPARAFESLASRHFDGIILDCDDVASAKQILARIREGPSNRQSPVVAVLSGTAEMRAFRKGGANFCICRPISLENIRTQLNKAFDVIQREHRRYFRYPVSQPLFLGAEKDAVTSARLINVSAEGMAVSVLRPIKLQGTVRSRFDLPSIEPYQVEATADVIWADAEGRVGIKLLNMPSEARRKYSEWLDVLHAQLEFRRFAEEVGPSNA
jgi:CheY-like chemotaxis protein